jgi:hypothetical protein
MAGKDNMSPGSNELMFGKKEQVPDEGQSGLRTAAPERSNE